MILNDINVGAKHASPLRKYKSKIHGPKSNSIGAIISSTKSEIAKQINDKIPDKKIWQRNYYEHLIRTEESLNRICRYVINNPAKWTYDVNNRNNLSLDEKQKFWSKFLNEYE